MHRQRRVEMYSMFLFSTHINVGKICSRVKIDKIVCLADEFHRLMETAFKQNAFLCRSRCLLHTRKYTFYIMLKSDYSICVNTYKSLCDLTMACELPL